MINFFSFKKCWCFKENNQDSTKYNRHMLTASTLSKRHQPNYDDLTAKLSNEDPFGKLYINSLNKFNNST